MMFPSLPNEVENDSTTVKAKLIQFSRIPTDVAVFRIHRGTC